MTDRRPEGTAYTGASGSPPPVPADMPDQQTQEGEDALDIPIPERVARESGDRPDPDEAGSGKDEPRNAGAHPEEHPTPDESSG
ncbi:hypothetical protein ACFYX8_28465 [Streptomyces cyaneofuscatus]|uniref:hypothetical protein n=1 Tax=Streptomyces TaxID=1883 RepID=UPI000360198A|nr:MULTISPECIES: hypothetical protein [Streptomyces]MZF54115.1 hypothetical protein [Streptomyces sp. SID5594]PVC83849.1 hypothetical protein DBP19_32535 [Streptomyces sp. CS090A]WRO14434.1 hypothetical protein SJX93_34540 [Streptomyces cyaneofuscatus]